MATDHLLMGQLISNCNVTRSAGISKQLTEDPHIFVVTMDLIWSNSWFRDSVHFDKAAAKAANVPGISGLTMLEDVGSVLTIIHYF